jgi:hypothetical protein
VKTTIAITSFNRFKYTKALLKSLESLSRELFYFIVVDNCSLEPGLQDFILEKEASGEIQKAFVRNPEERNWTNDEYIAKNLIIENSPTESILFLQDDLCFIGNEKSLITTVDDFVQLPGLCLEMNGVRRVTLGHRFFSKRVINGPSGLKYWVNDDNHFQTMGLFKKQIFNIFGPYPTDWPQTQEFWGRSEDWYDQSIKARWPNMQINLACHVPMFVPVWNDIRGGYAFIRGDRRYGQYTEPPHKSGLYYQALNEEEYTQLQSRDFPLSFPETAKPLGWNFARDEFGDQKKYSQKEIMQQEFGLLVSEKA